ncbi:hypothetical protein EVAR_17560_1 [Eumeta japonica]|uniref:Uncharacterized protein n=1 Tax=Eumeta variegata TaxID=151549 RepID=A0A4C1UBR4_EUMVA|nr:hypothetical protein EVAR_17560_1 [Eumeta japonica]
MLEDIINNITGKVFVSAARRPLLATGFPKCGRGPLVGPATPSWSVVGPSGGGRPASMYGSNEFLFSTDCKHRRPFSCTVDTVNFRVSLIHISTLLNSRPSRPLATPTATGRGYVASARADVFFYGVFPWQMVGRAAG